MRVNPATPEPPAPTPSATTCANCGHDEHSGRCPVVLAEIGLRCNCPVFVPAPASAPAATAGTEAELARLLDDYADAVFGSADDSFPTSEAEVAAERREVEAFFTAQATELAALRARVEELEADKARLDWIQSCASALSFPGYPRLWDVSPEGDVLNYSPLTDDEPGETDVRKAIDAAKARAALAPRQTTEGHEHG